jgi:hypothetical protein
MSRLIKTRTAQYPLVKEFTLNFDDTMANTSGVRYTFGSAIVDGATALLTAQIFDVMDLPVNAVVIGGEWITETAFDTAGYDVIVGDSVTANRYLASTDVKALGRTALVPTGYVADALPIRVTIATDDVCTTGKGTLRVMYTIRDRACENA